MFTQQNKKTLILLFIVLCMWFLQANFAQEYNGQTSEIVDPNLARFAALEYAEKFYGDCHAEFYVYDKMTYYSLEDQPDVYAFTLCSDVNDIPGLNELKVTIQDKYNDIKKLKDSITSIKTEPLSGKTKYELRSNLRKQVKVIRQQLRQEKHFVTVLCGATEQHVPVIRAHKGLPEHLTLLPGILQTLNNDPNLEQYKPAQIYYLGLFDLGYALKKKEVGEFQKGASEISEQRVICMKNKKIYIKSEMIDKRAVCKAEREVLEKQQSLEMQKEAQKQSEERTTIIKGKWQRLKEQYKNQTQKSVPNK